MVVVLEYQLSLQSAIILDWQSRAIDVTTIHGVSSIDVTRKSQLCLLFSWINSQYCIAVSIATLLYPTLSSNTNINRSSMSKNRNSSTITRTIYIICKKENNIIICTLMRNVLLVNDSPVAHFSGTYK